ncbi:hypothetical protein [Halospeciosus flavus]|uniref:RNA ligase domain-containing protein n=1 Tax=Halospeciosus flavus TaxID=3032283 RepID=A0ABD5Z3A2_9EURY|nr:hypothetical protein [Halospeciosus flavus]
MKEFPDIPDVANAPDALFEEGHLWLYELVDGVPLRFRLTEYGTLRFGDRERTYKPDDVPLRFRHAARHVRERLDRDALRAAVDDPTDVVFFGVATIHQSVDYDWARLPSFLAFDVWNGGREQFLAPETVETVVDQLGLHPLDTVDREVNTRDFDPGDYEIPTSRWYDGPAAGVLVRNKRGGRAQLRNPAVRETDTESHAPRSESPAALARRHATTARLSRVVDELEAHDRPVTFDAVYERVFETIVREEYRRLFDDGVDVQAFRAALADVIGESLDGDVGQ